MEPLKDNREIEIVRAYSVGLGASFIHNTFFNINRSKTLVTNGILTFKSMND